MDTASLDHEAQAYALRVQSAVAQLLCPTGHGTASSVEVACAELHSVCILNDRLQHLLNSGHSTGADEVDDSPEACSQRAVALDKLMKQLDDSVCSLRSQLDNCQQLLKVSPCLAAPDTIVKYSHTLRHVFQPLGITAHQFGVPPAPQEFHFIPSLLKKYHEAKQREQAAAPQPLAPAQAAEQHQLLAPQQQLPLQHRQEPIDAQQAAAPGAMVDDLNPDLADETADEEYSSSSDDDYSS